MKKELIKKYKAEFDHWLNGGKLLIKMSTGWEPIPIDYTWHLTGKLIIINDEYVEFRKALAEGKIIQVYDIIKQHLDNPEFDEYGWKDFKSFKPYSQSTYEPNRYRIKPEEPKFKVGDWTVNKTSKERIVKKVTSVYSDTVTVGNSTVGINVMSIDDLELWEPKEGDICWFWNKSNIYPRLATFTNNSLGLYYADISKDGFDFCEPFIGNLPTKVKE